MKPNSMLCVLWALLAPLASADELEDRIESRKNHIEAYPVAGISTTGDLHPDLADYTRTALLNNAGLRAAFDQWRAGVDRVPQAGAFPDPMFSFTYFVEAIETRTGPQNARLQFSQQIPWIGKLRYKEAMAEDEAESLWWHVEAKILEVRRDTAIGFADYANLGQQVRILRENLVLLRDLEPIVQRLIQAGGRQDDLLRLQVEIGKVENSLESHLDRRESFSARLQAIMNVDDDAVLPWPEPLSDRTRGFALTDLEPLVEKLNPRLRALAYQVEVAEDRIGLARAAGRPDFNVGVGYMETGSSVMMPRPSDSGDDPISITVGLTLPLGRGKYKAGKREALAHKSAVLHQRGQLRNDLQWRLEQTLYELDDAIRQVTLFRDSLIPRGRQALELTEIAYESGAASLLDVIDSQRELLDFELSYWKAVRDYHQTLAGLETLCGGNLP